MSLLVFCHSFDVLSSSLSCLSKKLWWGAGIAHLKAQGLDMEDSEEDDPSLYLLVLLFLVLQPLTDRQTCHHFGNLSLL